MQTYKLYKVKKLIPGQYLGKQFIGKYYIAIPAHKFEADITGILVRYKNYDKFIAKTVVPVWMKDFEDKWGRGEKYILNYYVWGDMANGEIPDEPHTIPMF